MFPVWKKRRSSELFKVDPKVTQTPPHCVVPTGPRSREKKPDKFGVLSDQVKTKAAHTQAREADPSDQQELMHMLYSLVRNSSAGPAVCFSTWRVLNFVS